MPHYDQINFQLRKNKTIVKLDRGRKTTTIGAVAAHFTPFFAPFSSRVQGKYEDLGFLEALKLRRRKRTTTKKKNACPIFFAGYFGGKRASPPHGLRSPRHENIFFTIRSLRSSPFMGFPSFFCEHKNINLLGPRTRECVGAAKSV